MEVVSTAQTAMSSNGPNMFKGIFPSTLMVVLLENSDVKSLELLLVVVN